LCSKNKGNTIENLKQENKYIEDYLREISNRRLSEYTYKSYEIDLRQFEEYIVAGNLAFETVTNQNIKFYLANLMRTNKNRRTIARKLSSLKTFFYFLSKNNIRKDDPTIGLKPPKAEKLLPHFLENQEIESLLVKPDTTDPLGARDSAILEVLYSGGLRVAELVSLKLTDVKTNDDKMQTVRIIGKGNKERIVIFGSMAQKAIKNYLLNGRPQLVKNAKGKESDELFLNRFGVRITTRSIARMLHKYVMLTSAKRGVSPHTLRHTFATHMLNNGADLRTLQQLLGHSSLSATEIYTHLSHERIYDVYQHAHPRGEKK